MPLLANINVGSAPNDGTGANLRSAFTTVNENFQFIEAFFPNTSNISLTANIDSTGTSTFNNVTVSNLTVTNTFTGTVSNVGTAQYVTGNAQANITSVGILTGLTLSGGLTGTTISAATIGNSGAAIVGTLSTASQPNITSVGTLSSLTLNGLLSGTSIEAATIGNTGANLVGTIGSPAQPNITTIGTLSNLLIATSGFISGSNIAIARVSGFIRSVDANTTGNSTSFSVPFSSNGSTQLHNFQVNANCTISYPTVNSGLQHFVTVKNVSASTANVILPNTNNNKASNVIPIAAGAVGTFIFTSYDSTSANVTVTVINS
jgi:hypothetical protein